MSKTRVKMTTSNQNGYVLQEEGMAIALQFSPYGDLKKYLKGFIPDPLATGYVNAFSVLTDSKNNWEVLCKSKTGEERVKAGSKNVNHLWLIRLEDWIKANIEMPPLHRRFTHNNMQYMQVIYIFTNDQVFRTGVSQW